MSNFLSRLRQSVFTVASLSLMTITTATTAATTATTAATTITTAAAPNMARVGGGAGYTAIVRDDGTLWTIGNSTSHARGTSTSTELRVVPALSGVTYISTGQNQGYALLNNGQVMAWGSNTRGQLGDGTQTSRAHPVAIVMPQPEPVVAVSAGNDFGMLLTESGEVRLAGYDYYGQMANSNGGWGAVTFPNNEQINYISAGAAHALAIDSNGQVWAWGSNSYGQVGRYRNGWSDTQTTPYLINALPNDRRYIQVAAGVEHSYAVDEHGNLWSWGRTTTALGRTATDAQNNSSQPAMVDDPAINTVRRVLASSSSASVFVEDNNNHFWALGTNSDGYLATGTTENADSFTAMRFDDIAEVAGNNALQFGNRSSYALAANGNVFAWGRNDNSYNVLAQTDRDTRTLPTRMLDLAADASAFSTQALKAPQRPFYWLDVAEQPVWLHEDSALVTPAMETDMSSTIRAIGSFYGAGQVRFEYQLASSQGELQLYLDEALVWSSEGNHDAGQVSVTVPQDGAEALRFVWIASADQNAGAARITQVELPAGELAVVSSPRMQQQYFNAVTVEAMAEIAGTGDIWLETEVSAGTWLKDNLSERFVRETPYQYSYRLDQLDCSTNRNARIGTQARGDNTVRYSPIAMVSTLSCDTPWIDNLRFGASSVTGRLDSSLFYGRSLSVDVRVQQNGGEWQQGVFEYDSRNGSLRVTDLACESNYNVEFEAEFEGGSVTQRVMNIDTSECVVGYDIAGGTSFSGEDQCFIATAAYGSLLHPKVKVLRNFRDERLRGTALGDAFIRTYYEHSPKIAAKVREHSWLASIVRAMLWPIIGLAWLALHMPWVLAFSVVVLVMACTPAVRARMLTLFRATGGASKRLLAALAALVLVSGCASGPSATHEAEQHMREQMRQMTNEPGWNFGHGVGMEEAEAIQNARYRLAEQVLVNVRSESERQTRENGEELSESFTRSVFSWSNVQLENAVTDVAEKHGDGWYARVRMTDRDLRRSIERAHRNAPSLDKVLQLERVVAQEPARRLRRALEGMALVQRDGVGNEAFTKADGGSATLGNYFQAAAEDAVSAMRVVPILEKSSVLGRNQLRFALIDRKSHRPQPGVVLQVDGREMVTDEAGLTDSIGTFRLSDAFDVHVLGYSLAGGGSAGVSGQEPWLHPELDVLHAALFLQDELSQAQTTTVLIYKDPDNANILVDNVSQEAPRELELSSGNAYRVTAQTDQHRPQSVLLDIPSGAAYGFLDFRLQEREYGTVSLNSEGRDSRLKVYRNGQLVLTSERNAVEQEVEIGVYQVEVGRLQTDDSFNPDFQVVEHRFNLTRDAFVDFNYAAPAYRSPYHHGWRFGLMFVRAGGALQDNFTIPWVEGRDVSVGELNQIERVTGVDKVTGGANFEVQAQRYFNAFNFTAQFAAGTADHRLSLTRESGSAVDLELESWFASAGVGFWYSAFDDVLISSLTVNAGVDMSRWSDESSARVQLEQGGGWHDLSSGRVTNTYTFAELNTHFGFDGGSGVSLGVQVPLDTFDPMVRLGVSLAVMDSGYRIPARASAQRGRHVR